MRLYELSYLFIFCIYLLRIVLVVRITLKSHIVQIEPHNNKPSTHTIIIIYVPAILHIHRCVPTLNTEYVRRRQNIQFVLYHDEIHILVEKANNDRFRLNARTTSVVGIKLTGR